MQKGQTGKLGFTARVDLEQAKRDLANLEKMIKDAGILTSKGFGSVDLKPLTEYQKAQLKIKQEAAEAAKQRAEQAAAEKRASQAVQDALKKERLERAEINKQIAATRLAQMQANQAAKEKIAIDKQSATSKKRTTQVSNSQAEIDAYLRSQKGSILYTSSLRAEEAQRAKVTTAMAAQAAATKQLTLAGQAAVTATKQQTSASQANALTKKQLNQMIAEEKYRLQQSNAELKNNARENLNAKGSLEQRRAALIRLTKEYDRLSAAERNTAAGRRLLQIIKDLTEQIKALEVATGRFGRNVGNYGSGAAAFFKGLRNEVEHLIARFLSWAAVIAGLKEVVHINQEVAESFTDVQRTAKLSNNEVDDLIVKLKAINTRTPLAELLDIGFAAGRLGIAKEDLVGFIKQVDELAVVLKKEFPGGADAIATSFGKIISVYKIVEKEGISMEEAMRRVGSAMLEVSHSKAAPTLQYLQDFTLGTAGVAQNLKLTLPTLLAFGGVLSKAGISASTAATNVTRFLSDIATKRERYYAIAQLGEANLTLEEFTNLLNTDANKALQLFFKGLKAGNPTAVETADRLKTLNLTAGKTKATVIALSEAQDLLNESVAIGKKGYEEGISIAHNFELANNNLGAAFDKMKNKIANAFTDSETTRSIAHMLNSMLDTRTEAEKLAEEYAHNKHEADNLEKALNPLVERYDILKSKTSLTTVEQEELRDVTAKIGRLLPGVIENINQYGDAVSIARGKISELTKAQRDLLRAQNRDAIEQANAEFVDLQGRVSRQQKVVQEMAGLVGKTQGAKTMTNRDVTRQQDYLTVLSGRTYEIAKSVREMGGELTAAQKKVIAFYETVDSKRKPPKKDATIIAPEGEEDATRTIADIKADIKRVSAELSKLDTKSDAFRRMRTQLAALKRELKEAQGLPDRVASTTENKQIAMQKRIDAALAEARRKQLSANQEEIQQVRDKYEALIKEVERFNKNPKNVAKVGRVGALKAEMNDQIGAITYRQGTDVLKQQLDKEQELYESYEDARSSYGGKVASARFEKELDLGKTYAQRLAEERDKILERRPGQSITERIFSLTGPERERLAEIDTRIQTEQRREQDKYDTLLKDLVSFEEQRLTMEQVYQDKRAELLAKGREAQIAVLDRIHKEEMDRLKDENIQKMDAFVDFNKGIDELTVRQAKAVIGRARAQLDAMVRTGQISKELAQKTKNELDEAAARIEDRIPAGLVRTANAFQDIASQLDGINEKTAEWLRGIADVAGQTGNIMSGMKELQLYYGKGDVMGSIGAGVQLVSSALSITKALTNALTAGRQRDNEQARADSEAQSRQFEAINNSLERQIEIAEKAYGVEKIAKYAEAVKSIGVAAGDAEGKLKSLYRLTGDTEENAVITKINNGEKLNVFDKMVRERLEKRGQLVSAFTDNLQELQLLIDTGKLDESTARIAQSYINMQKQIIEANNAIKSELTGTTFQSIGDGLVEMFAKADNAASDFGKNFEDIMRKALLNSIKTKTLADQLQKFYDDFANYAGDKEGLTEQEIANLRAEYDAIVKAGNERARELEKITGIDLSDDETGSPASRAIKSITSDQANALEGIQRGQFEHLKVIRGEAIKTNDLLATYGKSSADYFIMARDNFAVQTQIERNTANTVAELKNAVAELKAINSNTKGTTLRGSGLG